MNRTKASNLRDRLSTQLDQALRDVDENPKSATAQASLNATSAALSAVCLEDIANTLRVMAFGAVTDTDDESEAETVEFRRN